MDSEVGQMSIANLVLNDYYLGYFGDKRLESIGTNLFKKILSVGKVVINKLSINRAEQIQMNRFLNNDKVSLTEIKNTALCVTHDNAKNIDHVLSIQDTCEFNFASHKNKITDLGHVSNSQIGRFIHPAFAIDAADNFVIGLAGLEYWDRDPNREKKNKAQIPIEEKETMRWIDIANEAKKTLNKAKMITHIGDRENDIYEFICKIPDEKNHILVRSKHNRNVINKEGKEENLNSLFNNLEVNFCYETILPTRLGKRKKRVAKLNVKYTEVKLIQPKNNKNLSLLPKIFVTVLDISEDKSTVEKNEKALHWRLITTHKINSQKDGENIITWYKKRWNIEQLFRTMKLKGLNSEETQVSKANYLYKIMFLSLLSAIKIMQLTLCRNGEINRKGNVTFSKKELDCMEMLLKKYEGKTDKQKNPFKKKTLAWCSWIIARIGGWKGYTKSEGSPGPTTFKYGLSKFESIFEGWSMVLEI